MYGCSMYFGIVDGDHAGRLRFQKLRVDPDVFELTQIVARERGVSLTKLLRRSRGSGRAASARQLAIYLAHTTLGRPQEVVAELFSRERSTIAHAVHSMEDNRDNVEIDQEITRIELAFSEQRAVRDAA